MITGDHPLTAGAIAHELGIVTDDASVVSGAELAAMDKPRLESTVRETSVYARVSPEHKIRIVSALQRQGQVVAMTGDGVNDAPALEQADIGVAMGITGQVAAHRRLRREPAALTVTRTLGDRLTAAERPDVGSVVRDGPMRTIWRHADRHEREYGH